MGFKKQPALRVVVAKLKHCLAKARLAISIEATIVNQSNHQLDSLHVHNESAMHDHINA